MAGNQLMTCTAYGYQSQIEQILHLKTQEQSYLGELVLFQTFVVLFALIRLKSHLKMDQQLPKNSFSLSVLEGWLCWYMRFPTPQAGGIARPWCRRGARGAAEGSAYVCFVTHGYRRNP